MGRIRTKQVKRIAGDLIDTYPTLFKKKFDDNKKLVGSKTDVKTKKLRNMIAGYITKKIKIGLD